MFTGLIEQIGEVIANQPMVAGCRLTVKAQIVEVQDGESIAINGVCLTLLPESTEDLIFDVSSETLKCTALGLLQPGDEVNLERAMSASARFGGHYVSGHVDTTRVIKSTRFDGDYLELIIGEFKTDELGCLPTKGSITVDGVSLTVNEVTDGCVKLLLIPHTLAATNLGQRKAGDKVNIEFDYLAKMVSHQIKLALNSP